jgi:hypothetical protein
MGVNPTAAEAIGSRDSAERHAPCDATDSRHKPWTPNRTSAAACALPQDRLSLNHHLQSLTHEINLAFFK